MSDHQNQASLINSVNADGNVEVHIHGDVHANAGDDRAFSQLPTQRASYTAAVHNEGQMTQTFQGSSIHITGQPQVNQPSIDTEHLPGSSSQCLRASQDLPSTSKNISYTAAAIAEQVTQNFYGQRPNVGEGPKDNEKVMRMLRTINKEMWNKVNSNVQVCKRKSNVSLNGRVYPQFATSDFYEGFPQKEDFQPPEKKGRFYLRRREYVKDDMFQIEKKGVGRSSHSFKSVMKEFCQHVDHCSHEKDDEKLAVFGLFAQAGAGKTTCMRH